MATRYVRDEEIIPRAINQVSAAAREALVPTGTEKAQTTKLAQDLKIELEVAQLELTQALADAAAALEEAGLARTEASQAVLDAAAAVDTATEAYNKADEALDAAISADGRLTVADAPPVAADGTGKPVGALWIRRGAGIEQMWEWTSLGWVLRPLDETIIPKIAIGTGTYGDLAGDRLVARSIVAGKIEALSLTASELAANAVTAVKIAANAVTAVKIQAGAVVTDKLDALAVTAAKLAVGSVIAEKIATGAIVAGKIAADAIDGMTITGAIIRTAATGQRVQLDAFGLRTFSGADLETTRLSSDGLGMLISGPAGRIQMSALDDGPSMHAENLLPRTDMLYGHAGINSYRSPYMGGYAQSSSLYARSGPDSAPVNASLTALASDDAHRRIILAAQGANMEITAGAGFKIILDGHVSVPSLPGIAAKQDSGTATVSAGAFAEFGITAGARPAITVEFPTLVRIVYRVWVGIPTGGQLRVGTQLSGATSAAPNFPEWSSVIQATVSGSYEITRDIVLNPGTTEIGVWGYRVGSVNPTVSYQHLQIIPIRHV